MQEGMFDSITCFREAYKGQGDKVSGLWIWLTWRKH